MVRIVSAAVLAAVSAEHAIALPSNWTTPPEMTAAQKSVAITLSEAAKKASRAATPQVLSFFASDAFRKALQECCPTVAQYSAHELLEQFRAEIKIAELAHAFPSEGGGGSVTGIDFTDVTPDVLRNHDWFPNEWQAGFLSGKSTTVSKNSQNKAVVELFKLPVSPDVGYSWDEASDRLIYTALNMLQLDTGSQPNYGDVTAIFSTNYVKDMLFISPVDTGNWWNACKEPNPSDPMECGAWETPVVGTLNHLDHLILPAWGLIANPSLPDDMVSKAIETFSHSAFTGDYTQFPNLTKYEYWETNIVGNPRLTESVKFLIANFPSLFGTDAGRNVQRLADEHNWPLVWAFGNGYVFGSDENDDHPIVGPMNLRFIDPGCAQNTNMTSDHGHLALHSFNTMWLEAEEARSQNKTHLSKWWAKLQTTQTRVAPLTSHSCSDSDKCFGTSVHDQDCICKVSVPSNPACSANPGCADLAGLCCPTLHHGVMLECCKDRAPALALSV